MSHLPYLHVDVFSATPFGGNSLPVFYEAGGLEPETMLRITREMRHFEAIFLQPEFEHRRVATWVFDLLEELPFAGHPLIGAAVALQHLSAPGESDQWTFDLPHRSAAVRVAYRGDHYHATLDQGEPAFLGIVEDRAHVARAFALEDSCLAADLPLEVSGRPRHDRRRRMSP